MRDDEYLRLQYIETSTALKKKLDEHLGESTTKHHDFLGYIEKLEQRANIIREGFVFVEDLVTLDLGYSYDPFDLGPLSFPMFDEETCISLMNDFEIRKDPVLTCLAQASYRFLNLYNIE